MLSLSYHRVEEFIAGGRDKFIVDPDPNQIYTKRKAKECSISLPDYSSKMRDVPKINYPTTGWGQSLETLPLFTKAEMKKHREFWKKYGKRRAPFCSHEFKKCKDISSRRIFKGY